MILPETNVELQSEMGNWDAIIHTPQWVVFTRWIKEHIDYLEKKSKEHLRNHEDRLASEVLYAADDWRKTLESVKARIKSINEKIQKGEK